MSDDEAYRTPAIPATGDKVRKVVSLECGYCGRFFPDRSKVNHAVHFHPVRKYEGEMQGKYSHCYTSQRR